MEILDNLLPKEEFKKIEHFLVGGGGLPWTYLNYKVYGPNEEDPDNYQFVHPFYFQESCNGQFKTEISPYFEYVIPILNKLEFIALHRVKGNLEPLKSKRFYSDFHTDWGYIEDGKKHVSNSMTTAIYYVNTCDGYTEFEDGTKVKCKANRLVKFPSSTEHRGVSQTNRRVKSVINLNFFEL